MDNIRKYVLECVSLASEDLSMRVAHENTDWTPACSLKMRLTRLHQRISTQPLLPSFFLDPFESPSLSSSLNIPLHFACLPNITVAMAALTAFSVASNAISLADIAFKLGKETFEIYDRHRHAAQSVPRLLSELQALMSVISHTQMFLRDFEKSPFAVNDKQILPNLQTILTLCENEFRELRKIASEVKVVDGDSWLERLRKSWRWTAEDKSVEDASVRLHRLGTNLTAALSVTGRQQDIAIRKEMQETRNDIATLFQTLTQYTISVTTKAPISPQAPRQIKPFRHSKKRALIITSPKAGTRSLSNACDITRKVVSCGPLDLKNTQSSTYDLEVQSFRSYASQLTQIGLFENQDQTLALEAEPEMLEQITLPLILLRKCLRQAFDIAASSGNVILTKSECFYIKSVLDQLLASCHNASADFLSLNSTTSQELSKNLRPVVRAALKPSNPSRPSSWSLQSMPRTLVRQLYATHTPLGRLEIDVAALRNSLTDQMANQVFAFSFSFRPTQLLAQDAISVTYMSNLMFRLSTEPPINRIYPHRDPYLWTGALKTSLGQSDTASYSTLCAHMSSNADRHITLSLDLWTSELPQEASIILRRMNRAWPIRIGDIQLWKYEATRETNKPQKTWNIARYLQGASNERYFSAQDDIAWEVPLRRSAAWSLLCTPLHGRSPTPNARYIR
ncbi:hypothetical protein BU16DRAFT_298216 [Lophium mytilinum]|uniref:Fungal N-terminal domain-containing protein n=1 Tax=Lophium mytilinum TaxID=390894 RepID=A0A6A6R1D9_9PEZI|nr:hypothetical protein BU16DRAFT_298216 [Lophium mytilinum]